MFLEQLHLIAHVLLARRVCDLLVPSDISNKLVLIIGNTIRSNLLLQLMLTK